MGIRLPTMALKPRGDVTRIPKQGYQYPHKMELCPPKIKENIIHEHIILLILKLNNVIQFLNGFFNVSLSLNEMIHFDTSKVCLHLVKEIAKSKSLPREFLRKFIKFAVHFNLRQRSKTFPFVHNFS